MSDFSKNVVSFLSPSSNSLATLFKNINIEDPNIYVLFCGHCCRTDKINATFLTYDNLTLNAKILNINIWTDVGVAVLENPKQVDFPITTVFDPEPIFAQNQDVFYFSNYELNNSSVRVITSNVRDPKYRYPQNTHHFFYPESILLREAQGVKGISGSPVIDTDNKFVGLASKIVGSANAGQNASDNLVVTKMQMIYGYLFNERKNQSGSPYGLIPSFYQAYQKSPDILTNFNKLVAFRNSFNIIICHIGFHTLSNREKALRQNQNLNLKILGGVLTNRMTGINKVSYNIINFLQKNDPNIYYFQNLFDFTEVMNDYYLNKTDVLMLTLEYTDRNNKKQLISLGQDGLVNYYVNGEPSTPVTVTYRLFQPSGEDGINMVYGPIKTVTVQPILVEDSKDGTFRYTSQLPRIMTSTSSRANAIMQRNLFNMTIGGGKYIINYADTVTDAGNGYYWITIPDGEKILSATPDTLADSELTNAGNPLANELGGC